MAEAIPVIIDKDKLKSELAVFLSVARTSKEVKEKFGLAEKDLRSLVKEIPDHDYYIHRTNGDLLYVVVSRESERVPKPKVWTPRIHKKQPLIWVQMPDDVSWDRLIIIPLADLHYGSFHCDEKLLNQRIREIEMRENAFAIIEGDLIENALDDSPGGAIYDQKMRPQEQVNRIIDKLLPIAHKILWATPGNHEDRTKKRCDLNPMRFICQMLKIPYFEEPLFANILWKGNVFTFYCLHGSTNAQTEGGKMNRAAAPMKFIDFTMFVVMGHVHDKTTNKTLRICRERKFDADGNLISFDLVERKQYVVICPSFYGYFGSYAAKRPFSPGSRGKIVMTLFANGDYHVPA